MEVTIRGRINTTDLNKGAEIRVEYTDRIRVGVVDGRWDIIAEHPTTAAAAELVDQVDAGEQEGADKAADTGADTGGENGDNSVTSDDAVADTPTPAPTPGRKRKGTEVAAEPAPDAGE